MDHKQQKVFIQKASLIRKNTVSIFEVYQFNPQTDKLGQGAYGTVYKCVHKQTKQVRAVKVINKTNVKYTERLVLEITIMELMDHPNILKLFETFEDHENLYMIIELCSGGDVFDKVLEKGCLTIDDAFILFTQYLRAVYYYQRFHIVHRDLKPENFLFLDKSNLFTLNVIDFGIAKKYKKGMSRLKTKSGTVIYQGIYLCYQAYYVAPEVLDGDYDEKCDIWSAGVILYVMLCGYPPFYGENEKEILLEIKHGSLQFDGDEWIQIDQQYKDFIAHMISPAKIRWSAKELLDFQLIQNFVNKSFKPDKQILTAKKMRDWATFPCLKKLGLLYFATQLDFHQSENYKKSFFNINKSQTGLISQEELEAYYKTEIQKKEMQELVRLMDCNENGLIDFFEFTAVAMEFELYSKNDNLHAMFSFLSDNKPTIKKDALFKLMTEDFNLNSKWNNIATIAQELKIVDEHFKGHHQPDLKFAEFMISEVNQKKDGVTFEEFKAMMTKVKK